MFPKQFIKDFSTLGAQLLRWLQGSLDLPLLEGAIECSYAKNPFFTPYMQRRAIANIAENYLQEAALTKWLEGYFSGEYPAGGEPSAIDAPGRKRVGIIMAGNIPLVGFHDYLTLMASGAEGFIKLSSKDDQLLPALHKLLAEINKEWQERVRFVKRDDVMAFHNLDGVISTGSNTTANFVSTEFSEVSTLVRGQRFSFAVVERDDDASLRGLEEDIFLYYGLGCMNVSYLLLSKNVDVEKVASYLYRATADSSSPFSASGLPSDKTYLDLYRRNKAIYKMEGEDFTDGGFFILKESESVKMPLGCIGYSYFCEKSEIFSFESLYKNMIQKKVAIFGVAQKPAVTDYADGIDTMRFLLGLGKQF